eukprot:g40436.t1
MIATTNRPSMTADVICWQIEVLSMTVANPERKLNRVSPACPSCGHDDLNENELLGYIQCTCYKCGWGQWPCMDGKWQFMRTSVVQTTVVTESL